MGLERGLNDLLNIFSFRLAVVLTLINCWDVKWATAVQDIFTYAKVSQRRLDFPGRKSRLSPFSFWPCLSSLPLACTNCIWAMSNTLRSRTQTPKSHPWRCPSTRVSLPTTAGKRLCQDDFRLPFEGHELIGFVYIAVDRNYLNFIIEELKDPVKNLPRAIAISCTLVTIVYVMANVSFYTILSPDEVLGSSAVAVTYAERAFGMLAWTIPGEIRGE